LNSIEQEINQGIDKIQFTEEQVENDRNICLLYYEHVRGHGNAAYDPSSDDGDLKKRGERWLRLTAQAAGEIFCSRLLLEKAKSVPGLSAWAKDIEELKEQRAENLGK